MDAEARERLADVFWERHANPKSGWSRTLTLPLLLLSVYHRKWRLLAAVLAFAAVNPLLFPPPDDEDAWMTRVVHAERWWTGERREGVLDLSYPNVLNVLNLPVTGYALWAAWRRRSLRAALGCALAMALKFWFVGELERRYSAAARSGKDG